MKHFRLTWMQILLAAIVVIVACKSESNSGFEKQRTAEWRKYQRSQKKHRKMVEKSYKVHLKNQSKPMRKAMKRDNRRMRRDKRRKARKYG